MRQHHYRLLRRGGRKPAPMRNIIDRMRRPHRRVESQDIAAQFEIAGRPVGEELVAVFEDRAIERAEVLLRGMTVRRVAHCGWPISRPLQTPLERPHHAIGGPERQTIFPVKHPAAIFLTQHGRDRKSTRLNSSHLVISYAVFCLKKKKNTKEYTV